MQSKEFNLVWSSFRSGSFNDFYTCCVNIVIKLKYKTEMPPKAAPPPPPPAKK